MTDRFALEEHRRLLDTWLRDMTRQYFGDFRRLVVLAALDELVAEGSLPRGLISSRVTVEPPRDPAHGDLATNAAMVLAGSVKEPRWRSPRGLWPRSKGGAR